MTTENPPVAYTQFLHRRHSLHLQKTDSAFSSIGLPAMAGQLGPTYAISIIYVPALMITHIAAFFLLLRLQPKA